MFLRSHVSPESKDAVPIATQETQNEQKQGQTTWSQTQGSGWKKDSAKNGELLRRKCIEEQSKNSYWNTRKTLMTKSTKITTLESRNCGNFRKRTSRFLQRIPCFGFKLSNNKKFRHVSCEKNVNSKHNTIYVIQNVHMRTFISLIIVPFCHILFD